MLDEIFSVHFIFINLNKNHHFFLKYKDKTEENIIEIVTELYNLKVKDKNFKFIVFNQDEEKEYNESLIPNYNNEIAIVLDSKVNTCNVEFIIKNVNAKNYKSLCISYGNYKYTFDTAYNNLSLSRIILLNAKLDFEIFLINNEAKIQKVKPKISNKRKNVKLEEQISLNVLGRKGKRYNISNEEEKKIIGKNEYFEEEDEEELKKKEFLNEESDTEEDENEIKVDYDIDNKENYSNLTFCIKDEINIILTIHNMNNDIILNDNNITNNKENISRDLLDKYIREIESDIKNLRNILNCNSLNFLKEESKKILAKYKLYKNDEIQYSLIDENSFSEQNYLLCIKSFYNHLIIIINEVIDEYVDLFYNYGNQLEIKKKEKIIKIYLTKLLNKFNVFNQYDNYFYKNNQNLDNLIVYKNNLSYKEKTYFLSCILTILLLSPKADKNSIIELFEIKDNQLDIYSKVKKFIFKIIDKLKKKSAYINGLELLMSRVKEDLNKKNNKNYDVNDLKKTFVLEMRDIEQLKETIKTYFPKIIVRIFDSQSGFNSHIDMFSGLMIINECIYSERTIEMIKGNYDDIKGFNEINNFVKGSVDLKNNDNNELYNKMIFKAFWRINHECFGHLPVLETNNKRDDTPTKFIKEGKFINSNDAGKILEFFFNHNEEKIKSIKETNCNVINLLKEELFVGKNFEKLWEKFDELENKNKEKTDEGCNFDEEDIFVIKILEKYDSLLSIKGDKMKKINVGKEHKSSRKKRFKI